MTRISFKHDKDGEPVAFKVEGHAGYARKGHDIVCAAITALVINTVNSLEQFTEDGFTLDTNESKGLISVILGDDPSAEARLLLKSLELGLTGVSQEYGNKFVSFTDWEV